MEVGIGAGHSFTEYRAAGIPFDPPAVRKERLAESVEILRRLLDGEVVDHHGRHYELEGVSVLRPRQEHVPILVGVNGRAALAHAAAHADIVGLTMLGRTLEGGQHHAVRWDPERLDATVAWIAQHARWRPQPPELNALGTHEEIAAHLLACRERWGISYFVFRDVDAVAPVIRRLRGEGR